MKKLITIILALALILPAAAYAVDMEIVSGLWSHAEDTADGMLLTSMYLTEEGIAYFVTQMFGSDGPGLGRAWLGSWELTEINTVHIIIGKHATLDLKYRDYNTMIDQATYDYYLRAELR